MHYQKKLIEIFAVQLMHSCLSPYKKRETVQHKQMDMNRTALRYKIV